MLQNISNNVMMHETVFFLWREGGGGGGLAVGLTSVAASANISAQNESVFMG